VLCLNNPLGGVRQNMEHQVRSAGVDRTRPLSTAERGTPHNPGVRPRAPEDLLVTLDLDPPTATMHCRSLPSWSSPAVFMSMYADDTQVHGFSSPDRTSSVDQLQLCMSASCIDDVANWMSSNRLQINAAMTEILCVVLIDTATESAAYLTFPSIQRSRDAIRSRSRLGYLYVDSDVSRMRQVSRTVSRYSISKAAIPGIRSIHRSLYHSVFKFLIVALVLTKLDFENATLAAIPSFQLNCLQLDDHECTGSSGVAFQSSRRDHITSLLYRLHWLHAPERIAYKQAVPVYQSLHGLACSDV